MDVPLNPNSDHTAMNKSILKTSSYQRIRFKFQMTDPPVLTGQMVDPPVPPDLAKS
jgi:hypothetical protein